MRAERQRRIRGWVWFAILPFLLYWLSIGPFFRWEHAAGTQKQYLDRKRLEKRVYAPVIWAEKADPTGFLRIIDYLNIQPWLKDPAFNYTALPSE